MYTHTHTHTQTNQFLERHKPWYLVASTNHHWLQTVLITAMESLRLCSYLLHPVIPPSSTEIINRLGFTPDNLPPEVSGDFSLITRDLHCLLSSKDSVRKLEVATGRGLRIGGTPLFNKV